MSQFNALGLIEPLQRALLELDYRTPTPIQVQAIPAILDRHDLVAEAQTGTGKTAAFALPLLQRLATASPDSTDRTIRALVLVPTRELALQVTESLDHYGRYLTQQTLALVGGRRIDRQITQLQHGVDILVATPGRLLDLLQQGHLLLDGLELLVLDEADRMLDLGFLGEMRRIRGLVPTGCQTLLFSATLSSAVEALVPEFLHNARWLRVGRRNSAAKAVLQFAYAVDQRDKADILAYLIQGGKWQQALVFTRTKKRTDQVAEYLQAEGIEAAALHGDKPQRERLAVLTRFAAGKLRILVATDVAARGLDIDALPRVVNYDLPNVAEAYVHRIGRTGRAGSQGQAISLVAPDERRYLQAIESLIGRSIPLKPVPFHGDGDGDESALQRPASKPRTAAGKARSPAKPKAQPPQQADDTKTRAIRPSLMSAGKRKR